VFGRNKKVTVDAIVRDKRSSGPGKIAVEVDANQMNQVTGPGEVHYRVCQAAGIPDSESHNISVEGYEIRGN
jgi:hypothetical protein